MGILIRNADIVTLRKGDEEPFLGDILIDEGRIQEVGGSIDTESHEVINAKGMVALPGLVNAHTHGAMTLLRGYADDLPLNIWLEEKIWPLEEKLTPEDIYWGTMLALAEMIRGGITAFADMYFFMDEAARAVEEVGIRACLCRGLVAAGGGADKSLREADDFVSQWHGGAEGRITAMFGPHAPYTCPPEFLEETVSLAQDQGVGIHIHLGETKKEQEDIKRRYGRTPFEYVSDLGLFEQHVLAAHCVHLEEGDFKILMEAGAYVAHCPQSNLKLASGVAPIPEMMKMGIPVALGTDGAASNNNLDLFEEIRLAGVLHKGVSHDPTLIPARDALEMATIKGVEALGIEGVGPLQVGGRADLILLDFDKPHLAPLHDIIAQITYSAGAADVDTVIVDGKILMEGRELKTMDEALVRRMAQRRMEHLLEPI